MAIEQANANAGADEIVFADGVSGTITLASNLPTITDAAGLVIDGGGDVTVNGLQQRAGSEVGPGAVLSLRNLTTLGFDLKNSGTLEVTDSTISGNRAVDGGGIYNSGTLTVTNSTISRNVAEFYGGGIYNSGTAEVTNSTIWRNYVEGNCCWPGGPGGGIYNSGKLEVTNSTISDNFGSDLISGWGIYNWDEEGATATLTNTIMDQQIRNCLGTFTDGGFNIDRGTSCGFTQATGSLSKTNPLLEPASDGGTLLADNGGSTQTVALQPDSPAVDLVGQGACPPPAIDQRGVGRPQEEACDSGAFELVQDTTPPEVVGTVPKKDGATSVALDVKIKVKFSVPMRDRSINTANIYLTKAEDPTTIIEATVDYVDEIIPVRAVLKPLAPLEPNTEYTVTVEGRGDGDMKAVKDASGTPLATDYTFSFTTGSRCSTC